MQLFYFLSNLSYFPNTLIAFIAFTVSCETLTGHWNRALGIGTVFLQITIYKYLFLKVFTEMLWNLDCIRYYVCEHDSLTFTVQFALKFLDKITMAV
jgi:hypothetical protein